MPTRESCENYPFYLFYNTPEAISAFDNLYQNKLGVQDKFISFWDFATEIFKHNKWIVGYDVLNEPALAGQLQDPMLILDHEKFDREIMSKFYERFHREIIAAKNLTHQMMFFEPPYFPDTMNIEGG